MIHRPQLFPATPAHRCLPLRGSALAALFFARYASRLKPLCAALAQMREQKRGFLRLRGLNSFPQHSHLASFFWVAASSSTLPNAHGWEPPQTSGRTVGKSGSAFSLPPFMLHSRLRFHQVDDQGPQQLCPHLLRRIPTYGPLQVCKTLHIIELFAFHALVRFRTHRKKRKSEIARSWRADTSPV